MNSLMAFVSTYPVIALVWFVGMLVSIGFCIAARGRHHRNMRERLAVRGRNSEDGRSTQSNDAHSS